MRYFEQMADTPWSCVEYFTAKCSGAQLCWCFETDRFQRGCAKGVGGGARGRAHRQRGRQEAPVGAAGGQEGREASQVRCRACRIIRCVPVCLRLVHRGAAGVAQYPIVVLTVLKNLGACGTHLTACLVALHTSGSVGLTTIRSLLMSALCHNQLRTQALMLSPPRMSPAKKHAPPQDVNLSHPFNVICYHILSGEKTLCRHENDPSSQVNAQGPYVLFAWLALRRWIARVQYDRPCRCRQVAPAKYCHSVPAQGREQPLPPPPPRTPISRRHWYEIPFTYCTVVAIVHEFGTQSSCLSWYNTFTRVLASLRFPHPELPSPYPPSSCSTSSFPWSSRSSSSKSFRRRRV